MPLPQEFPAELQVSEPSKVPVYLLRYRRSVGGRPGSCKIGCHMRYDAAAPEEYLQRISASQVRE
jgi:hypothetical protein